MKTVFAALVAVLVVSVSAYPQSTSDEDLNAELKRLTELTKQPLYARAPAWKCAVAIRFACSHKDCSAAQTPVYKSAPDDFPLGLKANAPEQWVRIDFNDQSYSRCDLKGCDKYKAKYTWSGAYTYVEVPDRSTFIKIINDGSSFADVASIGVTVINRFGKCVPAD